MKLSTIALSIALAANCRSHVAASSQPEVKYEEIAAAFHLSSNLVHEPSLRGAHHIGELEVPNLNRENRNRNNRFRANEWLQVHNDKREEYITNSVPLQWSDDLKTYAEDWANELAANCQNDVPSTNFGVNAAGKQGSGNFRTADEVMAVWENKFNKNMGDLHKQQEFLQVLWQATEYVGCADAVAPPGSDKQCTYSVCFYAMAGNCGLGQYASDEWLEAATNGRPCGPCPPDFLDCNSMV